MTSEQKEAVLREIAQYFEATENAGLCIRKVDNLLHKAERMLRAHQAQPEGELVDRPDSAIEALLNYSQADEDGVMVFASRQAIHEVVGYIEALSVLPPQPDAQPFECCKGAAPSDSLGSEKEGI